MHPYVSQALSAERASDMRSRAARARLARQVRRSRRAAPDPDPVQPAAVIPDTYEEFLTQMSGLPVAGQAVRPEPAAAGRPGRQPER